MSTTLTNGLKLPDKGSVDWYADMQSNYTILDGAVGTVAEHTSALSGKAPLVHTHGKADITDLFNSANTWSGDNTYSASINYKSSYTLGNLPASATAQSAFKILDSTGIDFICDINSFQNALATGLRFTTRNKMDANGFSPSGTIKANYLHFLQNAENKGYLQWDGYTKNNVIPLTTNTYDLGTSSYQWNNLYAKNYYYNGTAWGLDKANVWSAIQTISYAGSNVAIALKNQETDIAASPTRNNWHYINFYDKNSVALGGFNYSKRTNGNSRVYLNLRTKNINNDIVENNIFFETNQEGTDWNLYPSLNTGINLGTSTNKWKTLNGINPGALSLPSISDTGTNAWIALETTNWVKNAAMSSAQKYTPPADGWLNIRVDNATMLAIGVGGNYMHQMVRSETPNSLALLMPVFKNTEVAIMVSGNENLSYNRATFYYCNGNV